MLTMIDGAIQKDVHPKHFERIPVQSAIAYLLAQGFKPQAASAIATGALVNRSSAIELAKSLKLVS